MNGVGCVYIWILFPAKLLTAFYFHLSLISNLQIYFWNLFLQRVELSLEVLTNIFWSLYFSLYTMITLRMTMPVSPSSDWKFAHYYLYLHARSLEQSLKCLDSSTWTCVFLYWSYCGLLLLLLYFAFMLLCFIMLSI